MKPETTNRRWRHKARGSVYEEIGRAVLQTNRKLGDDADLVVYRGPDGSLWARPVDEFMDGRFERLTDE